MSQTIFLHGPVFWRTKAQLAEFKKAELQLTNLGFEVISAMRNYPFVGESGMDARERYLAERTRDLIPCRHIVYLEGYEYDHYTTADLKQARADGKLVQSITSFLNNYKNSATQATATAEENQL